MKKVFIYIAALGLITGCNLNPTKQSAELSQPNNAQSFIQLCQQKDSIAAPTKLTIDLLLKEADSNDCQQADAKLKSLTELDLYNNHLTDLSPLSGFNNLTTLDLSNNQISDLSPLAGLVNLNFLALSKNKIVDVTSLSKLSKLTFLSLNKNQIRNIRSLSTLTNLTEISVLENKNIDTFCPLEIHVCSF